MLLISVFLQVIYILNSCFQILYMCFRKHFTYLFSFLAYFTCVFPVIIYAWSLSFAYRYVLSDLLYIPNSCFWIVRMCFQLIAHTKFLFLNCPHVFPALLHIPNSYFWVVRMCFLIFCTYLILVFELSACVSSFFAHTRFLFFNFRTCIFKCFA